MQSKWPGIMLLLGCFAGLCALFAGIVTAFDAWGEHVRAGWPEAQARVSRCEIREIQTSAKSYYLRCSLAYVVEGHAISARVDSGSVPDPARVIWRSSGSQGLGDLQAWVDAHPAGTPIAVRYDPASPQVAALLGTDMPLGGPRTPADLRLLQAFGGACLVLLLVGGAWRRMQ